MKVGDYIDVYKVLTHGGYKNLYFTPNTYRGGYKITDKIINTICNYGHKLCMINQKEVTKIGRMKITHLIERQ